MPLAKNNTLQFNILTCSEIKNYLHWYKYLAVYKMSVTLKKKIIHQIEFLMTRWHDDISVIHGKQK